MTPSSNVETQQGSRVADESLELLPRSVRDKLDRVRIKLHLKEWQALSLLERARLRDLPCETAAEAALYASEVEQLIRRVAGHAPDRLSVKE